MTLTSWFQGFKGNLGRRRVVSPQRSFVLRLEALEDRTLPSTFTVLNLNDSGPGSLRAAVAAANANPGPDTVAFAKGVHGTITLTSGELSIADSVTIDGPGANRLSVSGNNTSRVFEIAAGQNVTISGLTISHGHALEQGGGILNDGSNLTLSGDDLSQNVAVESTTNSAAGGALQSLRGTLNITDCQITDNQALGAANPALFGDAMGGGIDIVTGSATISTSAISGNLAQAGNNSSDGGASGGGLSGGSSMTIVVALTISDCTFCDNLARGGNNSFSGFAVGGAMEFVGSATITGSTFSGNQVIGGNGGTQELVGEAEGGALYDGGTASISDSTFDHNTAIAGNGGNSGSGSADPSVDTSYGGAICGLLGISLTVTDCCLSHNEAIGGNNAIATGTDIVEAGDAEGGAICTQLGDTVNISGTTLDHNQAIGGDGNTGSGPVVHVGTALGGGINSSYGGVDVGSNTLTVSNSTLTHNEAQGGDHNSGTATTVGLVGAGVGAGIANYLGGTANVSGSELDHNQASGGHHNKASGTGAVFAGLGAGGGIFNYLGNYNSTGYGPLSASVVTVSNSTLDHNQAQGGGGGNGEGGGLANVGSATTTVNSTTITHNEANGDGGGAGLGGGAYNDATSTLALTKSFVTHNHANGSPGIGGGVYTLGVFSYDASTVIADNHASTSGDNIGP